MKDPRGFLYRLGFRGEPSRIDDRRELVRVGRDAYCFIEDGRKALVQVDTLVDDKRVICSSAMSGWEPPHEAEALTNEDRARIGQLIAGFFHKRGIQCEIY